MLTRYNLKMIALRGKLSRHFNSIAKRIQCRELSDVFCGPYNYVDGNKSDPVDSKESIAVLQPSTGQQLCCVATSGCKETDRAVSAAKIAFQEWSRLSNTQRGRLLVAAGKKIRDDLEDIAQVEVKNNGKPIWEARVDIGSCADAFEYFGGIIGSLTGQHVPFQGDSFAFVSREPLGVIAGIGAWNFPLQTCSWKVAPALACGNTMVFKPSPLTPLTALMLAELLEEVGVPKGVFNVIQGGAVTGNALCSHPSVAKISFTGSVGTGVNVMKTAAEGMKKVTLELGGKSPILIFDDADIVNGVKATLMANFLSQGAVCSNATRVFVHEKIADTFLDALVKATKELKIGDPFDEDTTVGATISKDHAKKVLKFITEAKDEGAVVAYGGEVIGLPPPLSGGTYISPCILTNCDDSMRVVKEEVFGAVLAFLTFSSEEEVIERANATNFGLAGAVFTRDIQRALRVVRRLEAGTLWINNYNLYPPEVPFGGYKFSGIGRENGTAVLEHYTQLKTVYVEAGDVDCGLLYKDAALANGQNLPSNMNLNYQDIVQLTNNKSIILIDVREPHELQETGELPESVNIPLNDLKSALKDLSNDEFMKKYGIPHPDKDAPIVFSCRSGNRSRKAIVIAQELGYKNVKHYDGGFLDWMKHNNQN